MLTSTPLTVRRFCITCSAILSMGTLAASSFAQNVSTTAQLIDAVTNGLPGATINVAAGVYELPSSLRLKSGMSIIGAGAGQTIIRNAPSFAFAPQGWYGDDVNFEASVPYGYLFDLGRDQANMTLRNMTLSGPQIFGGIHVMAATNITITDMEFRDFRWSGVRAYIVSGATIRNNTFVDAGGQTRGADGSFGSVGGSVFLTYLSNAAIENNRFSHTPGRPDYVYGIKGREFRNVRVANNTINLFFSIELPFENDYYVDIEYNYLGGGISMPRYAGGVIPPGANPYTFRIRNNYFNTSYAIEGPHNAMIVENNVFNFPVDDDGGNLFSSFDPWSENPAANGPLLFRNNIVINPGRGVFWSDVVWNNLTFTNNHIFCNEDVPSQNFEGLFGIRGSSPALGGQFTDWSTIAITNNIVQVRGTPRPLLRSSAALSATIANNQFINVADAAAIANPPTQAPIGLLSPLSFSVGMNAEFSVIGVELLGQAGASPFCDAIDFNRDGLFPDDADLLDFLAVLAGGSCSTAVCNDIDFNNDGLYPDDNDLLVFLTVLAGGACT